MAENAPNRLRRHLARVSPEVLIVVALTAVGLAIRLANFDQGFYGDELSSGWVVFGNSLSHVLSTVHSDAEISPPLFFVLGWASTKLGSNPDLLRLPSLIAGTATIPLVYALGARTMSRRAGVLAAAIVAFSPFLIYYSTEARAYALMIALVTGCALALLRALETRTLAAWALYAVLSAAAMYTHYTAAFPLAAMALWALWAHPPARREVLMANVFAALLFAPWISGYLADQSSPTTKILEALEPFTLHSVRIALQYWALGMPGVELGSLPGTFALALIVAGLGVAVVAGAIRLLRAARAPERPPLPRGPVLVAALALATPLGEALYSLVSTDLFGARDLNASWPGLALAAGGVLAALRPRPVAVAATAATVAGFAIGAARTLESRFGRPQYASVASLIDSQAGPGDVVLDGAPFTPTPLTPLSLYLDKPLRVYEPSLPRGEPPFTALSPVPPEGRIFRSAYRRGRDGRIYLVSISLGGYVPNSTISPTALVGPGRRFLANLPPGYHVERTVRYPGLLTLVVKVIAGPGSAAG